MNTIFVLLSTLLLIDTVNSDQNNKAHIKYENAHTSFDSNIYEEILDAEECRKQIQYLTLNDSLLMMTCKCY